MAEIGAPAALPSVRVACGDAFAVRVTPLISKLLILAAAKNKQDYSKEGAILIDDRVDTIREWDSQGGIGILHVSTANTIQKLKQLGL